MGEREWEGDSWCCECDFCGADIMIPFYLEQGDLVYCKECLEEYILASRYPAQLLPVAKRQMEPHRQKGITYT